MEDMEYASLLDVFQWEGLLIASIKRYLKRNC